MAKQKFRHTNVNGEIYCNFSDMIELIRRGCDSPRLGAKAKWAAEAITLWANELEAWRVKKLKNWDGPIIRAEDGSETIQEIQAAVPTDADCSKCVFSYRQIASSHHLGCQNLNANVVGNKHGINHGWFNWPLNFDPVWLVACDGFREKEETPAG